MPYPKSTDINIHYQQRGTGSRTVPYDDDRK